MSERNRKPRYITDACDDCQSSISPQLMPLGLQLPVPRHSPGIGFEDVDSDGYSSIPLSTATQRARYSAMDLEPRLLK